MKGQVCGVGVDRLSAERNCQVRVTQVATDFGSESGPNFPPDSADIPAGPRRPFPGDESTRAGMLKGRRRHSILLRITPKLLDWHQRPVLLGDSSISVKPWRWLVRGGFDGRCIA
jgi:hypothetical protein